jgi:hypothetical protein
VLGRAQDLVRDDWKGVYNRLGRDKVIELLKNNVSLSEAKKIKKEKKKNDEQKLFLAMAKKKELYTSEPVKDYILYSNGELKKARKQK